ncbi:MAG: cytochrome c3 family protein [bacterium]
MPFRSLSWCMLIIGIAAISFLFTNANHGWSAESQDEYMAGYIGAGAEKVGSDKCVMCHSDKIPASLFTHVALIDNNPENADYGFGCEGCHGPGGSHMGNAAGILDPKKMSVDGITDLCSKCHDELGSFERKSWLLSDHYLSDISCLGCHGGHSDNPKFLSNENKLDLCYSCHADKKAEFNMRAHHPVEESDSGCEMCHNPHSGNIDYQLNDDGDRLCFGCHADKEGPFIFNHDVSMASGGNGCLTCHFAHGSNADNLLRDPNRLCLQCHTDRGPKDHFIGSCWSTGCHTEIHGSNADPLFFK